MPHKIRSASLRHGRAVPGARKPQRWLLGASTLLAAAWLAGCDAIAGLSEFDGTKLGGADGEAPDDATVVPPDAGGIDAAASKSDGQAALPNDATVGTDAEGDAFAGGDGSGSAIQKDGGADAPVDAAPINYLVNPGFEQGITAWTTFTDGNNVAVFNASSAHAHSGQYSGWVSNRTAEFQGTAQDITRFVTAGQTYTVTSWAMVGPNSLASADGGTDAGSVPLQPVYAKAAVTCLIDAGTTMINYVLIASGVANTTSWTFLTGPLPIPTCEIVLVQLYIAGPSPGVELFVDEVTLSP